MSYAKFQLNSTTKTVFNRLRDLYLLTTNPQGQLHKSLNKRKTGVVVLLLLKSLHTQNAFLAQVPSEKPLYGN